MPIGIALYLVIKLGSDFSISNKAFIINSGTYSEQHEQKIEMNELISSVKKAQEKNNSIHIIKELSVKLDEIKFSSSKILDHFYFTTLLDSNNIGIIHNDMVSLKIGDSNYKGFVARVAYDEFIEHGNFSVKKSYNYQKFLYENNIVASRDLKLEQLNRFDKYEKISIVNLSYIQGKILENKKHIFAKGNSLLLLSSVNGLIRVMNC